MAGGNAFGGSKSKPPSSASADLPEKSAMIESDRSTRSGGETSPFSQRHTISRGSPNSAATSASPNPHRSRNSQNSNLMLRPHGIGIPKEYPSERSYREQRQNCPETLSSAAQRTDAVDLPCPPPVVGEGLFMRGLGGQVEPDVADEDCGALRKALVVELAAFSDEPVDDGRQGQMPASSSMRWIDRCRSPP